MKKQSVIVVFLTCISSTLFSQRDSVFVKTNIFTSVYSEILQQPKWVEYDIKCPKGKFPRTGMDFYTVPGIITSDANDYVNNVWDKGHCAPAADFNCDKPTLLSTFSYVNCVLQHENLNRGVWRILEVHERELALTSNVHVRIAMIYSSRSIKLPTGATVPDGFVKYIYVNGVLKEKYFFKNERPTSSKYQDYSF